MNDLTFFQTLCMAIGGFVVGSICLLLIVLILGIAWVCIEVKIEELKDAIKRSKK